MKYDSEIIGKRIFHERKKLGLTQVQLGKTIGTVGKQISSYEKGKPIPPIETMLKLCEVFDCELGYLLGESEYSEGTKIETAISNSTGLTVDTMNVIRIITGTEKKCLSFGYESDSYRSIFNSLFTDPLFLRFFECLHDLDTSISKYNNTWNDLEKEIGKKLFDEALELYNSTNNLEDDPKPHQLKPEQYKLIRKIESTIDKQDRLSYAVKISRYELHEVFEALIENLYPRNET